MKYKNDSISRKKCQISGKSIFQLLKKANYIPQFVNADTTIVLSTVI